MKEKDSKIINITALKAPKVGIIIFALIFVYMVVNIILYYRKDHLSIYEVQAEDLADDRVYPGVITRSEQLVETHSSGYVSAYVSSGSKVSIGMPVFSLSATAHVFEDIADKFDIELDENFIFDMKNYIYNRRDRFSLDSYDEVEEYREGIISKSRENAEIAVFNKLAVKGETEEDADIFQSSVSGVISFKSDSLFGLKDEDVTEATFDRSGFKVNALYTEERVDSGSPVYRVVTDENWKVTALVDEEFYIENLEKNEMKVRLSGMSTELVVPTELVKKGETYLCVLSLSDCMVKYIDERFVDVEFEGEESDGLKIPVSAITTKEFYVIPDEFISHEEETATDYVTVETKEGPRQDTLTVYYDDGENSYIDGSFIDAGSYIINPKDKSTHRITTIERLEGVFNVNRGYAVFRRIERIRENGEYCIIEKGTTYGLTQYDHIALDADTVTESAIIY
ncbi:MAG: hypothetical protein ILP10_07640 [Lachnospiraceae bacterium]|nr:hypothetical protein [Lachnospiraceae bacterium]